MDSNKTSIIGIAFTLALVVFYWIGIWTGEAIAKRQQEKVVEEKIREVYVSEDDMSEWVLLQLAIMKTESNFDPSAIGSGNALGLYQITPICAAEANRLLGEEKYSHLDAFDIRKSIEMFNIVQNSNNAGRSISKAISIQNPGGNAIGYGKKVYDNIRFIRRMEEARRELIKYEVEQRISD